MKKSIPDLRSVTDCKYFLEGRCNMASKCAYRHPILSKKFQIICQGWSDMTCNDASCLYAHPAKLADALSGVVAIKDESSESALLGSISAMLCPFYQTGYCRFGSHCKNLHSDPAKIVSRTNSSTLSQSIQVDSGLSMILTTGDAPLMSSNDIELPVDAPLIASSSRTSSNDSSSCGLNLNKNSASSILEKYSRSAQIGIERPQKRLKSDRSNHIGVAAEVDQLHDKVLSVDRNNLPRNANKKALVGGTGNGVSGLASFASNSEDKSVDDSDTDEDSSSNNDSSGRNRKNNNCIYNNSINKNNDIDSNNNCGSSGNNGCNRIGSSDITFNIEIDGTLI